jgi:alkylation response protein AidB-like acyl-CoA dehydrogenase
MTPLAPLKRRAHLKRRLPLSLTLLLTGVLHWAGALPARALTPEGPGSLPQPLGRRVGVWLTNSPSPLYYDPQRIEIAVQQLAETGFNTLYPNVWSRGATFHRSRHAPLEPALAGDSLVVLAHAEREARYNLAHVATTAKPKGDGWTIDGAKTAVVAGGGADLFIVSARLSGATRDSDGIGFFLVPASAAGVDRRAYRLADGSVAAEIALRGVDVGGDARLAGGLEALLPVVVTARAAAAAEMLGLMTLLFDTTLAYVKTRTQFGQSLGSFQVIQHRMTDAYVLVEQARSQVIRAALAEPADFARAAAGAKAFVADAALTVAHTAVQLHGGMGITDELVIGHALKRIRVLALTFGDGNAALDDYRRAA